MKPQVVMRSRNDMPLIAETLKGLQRQTSPFELFVFDNGSTDGTVEEVEKYSQHVIHVPEGAYVPGRVLNEAMKTTSGEFVVFLNSDCVPQDERFLEKLLSGFDSEEVAAVFGRQVARPDCWPIYAKDTEATFGDGARQSKWRHCFSMASSAIRRTMWEERPFNEAIQYSEDIEWTWWARQRGYAIRYRAESIVEHSHNYNLQALYRRHYGEGCADAVIFDWPAWERSWFRYSGLPWSRQVLSDWKYCLRAAEFRWGFYAPVYRLAQMLGRRAGFVAGLASVEENV